MYGNFDDGYQLVTHGGLSNHHDSGAGVRNWDDNAMCWTDQPKTWKLLFNLWRGVDTDDEE